MGSDATSFLRVWSVRDAFSSLVWVCSTSTISTAVALKSEKWAYFMMHNLSYRSYYSIYSCLLGQNGIRDNFSRLIDWKIPSCVLHCMTHDSNGRLDMGAKMRNIMDTICQMMINQYYQWIWDIPIILRHIHRKFYGFLEELKVLCGYNADMTDRSRYDKIWYSQQYRDTKVVEIVRGKRWNIYTCNNAYVTNHMISGYVSKCGLPKTLPSHNTTDGYGSKLGTPILGW